MAHLGGQEASGAIQLNSVENQVGFNQMKENGDGEGMRMMMHNMKDNQRNVLILRKARESIDKVAQCAMQNAFSEFASASNSIKIVERPTWQRDPGNNTVLH